MEEITKVSRSLQQKAKRASEDLQNIAENQNALLEQQKQLRSVERKFERVPEGTDASNNSSLGIGEAKDIVTPWKPDEFIARISAGPGEDSSQTLSAVLNESKKRIADYLEGPGSSEIVFMMTTMLEYVKKLSDGVKDKQSNEESLEPIPVIVNTDGKAIIGSPIEDLIAFTKDIFQQLSQRPNEDTVTLTERYTSLLSLLNDQK